MIADMTLDIKKVKSTIITNRVENNASKLVSPGVGFDFPFAKRISNE